MQTNSTFTGNLSKGDSPLYKREGDWNRNESRYWFWDRWNRSAIGQFFPLSLVTVPEVFAKNNSPQFPRSKSDKCSLEITAKG